MSKAANHGEKGKGKGKARNDCLKVFRTEKMITILKSIVFKKSTKHLTLIQQKINICSKNK